MECCCNGRGTGSQASCAIGLYVLGFDVGRGSTVPAFNHRQHLLQVDDGTSSQLLKKHPECNYEADRLAHNCHSA